MMERSAGGPNRDRKFINIHEVENANAYEHSNAAN